MKPLGCCGLDCTKCGAYIAYKTDDDELRKKTAEKWRVEFDAPEIMPEMINCVGCMNEGVKTMYCEKFCEIRKCCTARKYDNCGECSEESSCSKVKVIHDKAPEAKKNLRFIINN